MSNYYENWLRYWDDELEEKSKARTYINEEDLQWTRTRQDWRTALLCARESGFITSGVATIAEIPPGWHTGKHSHGEEAIYIVQGQGFSLVDGLKYDWETGSCLFMPYGSSHQHFNSGPDTVKYFSTMALPLERFCGLARIMQYEDVGETAKSDLVGLSAAGSDIHPEHGRIHMKRLDALVVDSEQAGEFRSKLKDEFSITSPKETRIAGTPGHRSRVMWFMGPPQNGFKAREVEITGILCDKPGMHSGKHAHMEALLYVLQGEGYSVVDGERIPWKTGTLFQVQGPQTVHQHFNTGPIESQQLRIHFGTRSHFFQFIARGVFPTKYYEYSSYGL
ncbi:MAG: cupin domain-containing protein [Chloroflexi bacterium]|nr:cupin domain-containing protein [Chloroflexota bacterium]